MPIATADPGFHADVNRLACAQSVVHQSGEPPYGRCCLEFASKLH